MCEHRGASLEDVRAALSQEGWRGFMLARRFVTEAPRQWRALARLARTVPWAARSDLTARQVRFSLLGSFSTGNIAEALTLAALERGVLPSIYQAPFNQASLAIRDPASQLYASQPDVVVLAIDPADRAPLSRRDVDVAGFLDELMREVELAHARSGALVLVHNFLAPEFRAAGMQGWRYAAAEAEFHTRLNLALAERCRTLSWAHVIDVARLQAILGGRWPTLHQPRFLGAYRCTEDLAFAVAREYAAIAAALKGFTKKCLVVDLDNTLWGGVVAEEGVHGIAIGGGYPGNLYHELQLLLRRLHERGVLLAINSKNNEADGWAPFHQRSEMLLQSAHFSAWRINWLDKATNLREIARELNLGLDSLVVLDDNPVERRWMEEAVPEVFVLPASDPLDMLRAVSTTLLFDGLEHSREDGLRAQSYAASAQRAAAQEHSASLDDFLAGLRLKIEVFRPQAGHLARVAQLTQKTNQFNLTTRRYTQEQLQEFSSDETVEVWCCSVCDRFADEGIVGVVILRRRERQCLIDTLLLSCRVLGRGVERALLWAACQRAAEWGMQVMQGEYRRSEKNGQTARFFREQGFTLIQEEPYGSMWTLALPAPRAMLPDWVTLTRREG